MMTTGLAGNPPLEDSRFRVEGMDCAACAAKVDNAVRRLPGVVDVTVSPVAGTMLVRHEAGADLAGAIGEKVGRLGYTATPSARDPIPPDRAGLETGNHDHAGHDHAAHEPGSHGHDHAPAEGRWWQSRTGRLAIAAGLALLLAWAVSRLVPALGHWPFVAAVLVGLVPIARRAAMAAADGMPFTIETLMTIAAAGAVAIGAGEEAAAVVFLFLVGELLEGVAASRARASIGALSALVPATAHVEEGGAIREVAAATLAIGARILVRPGDRVPADGVIRSGSGGVDESPVTGESAPVRKGVGDAVFAGTVNGETALGVEVTASAADNTIARVVRMVEEAQESRAPTARLIDRFARIYTPCVLVAGALVAIGPPLVLGASWIEWIYKGLAVLLIGCPCALVISTPAAIAASLSSGARRGLLMKGGSVLETLGAVTIAAMDKTGTLTTGSPTVTDIIAAERAETDILALAAALETGSSHPFAKAILARATEAGVAVRSVEGATALAGEGLAGRVDGVDLFLGSARAAAARTALPPDIEASVERLAAEGKTVSILLTGTTVAGLVAMRDELRPDARAGIAALKDLGIGVIMLTGDNSRTAAALAGQLGIEMRADLKPEDKQRIVRELQAAGQIVAKIGDGINDAPALAAANVGIAMGGGTDVALETADAAVLNGRVGDVAAMVALSRRTLRNIHQNITIALGLKVVFLATTIAGITGLWPAILADTGATVLVTANAMRLLRPGRL